MAGTRIWLEEDGVSVHFVITLERPWISDSGSSYTHATSGANVPVSIINPFISKELQAEQKLGTAHLWERREKGIEVGQVTGNRFLAAVKQSVHKIVKLEDLARYPEIKKVLMLAEQKIQEILDREKGRGRK